MPFLEWKDAYNIGVKEIDNQHRGLFDIIDKLDKGVKIDLGIIVDRHAQEIFHGLHRQGGSTTF